MRPLVILHGWSDTAVSFVPLMQWLGNQGGFNITSIWLGDYISMNDEVTLFDLGDAFRRALAKNGIPTQPHSFDLIVHSTGALVAREYLRQVCKKSDGTRDASLTPIAHICMLAPANFGSPLARLGKSVIGRFFKGWNWDHAFQSGQHVLDALDLASPYSYGLAFDDLFDPGFQVFDPKYTMATVLVGTCAYPGIKSTFHENGSDGTVRVATASLNAVHFAVDFSDPAAAPGLASKPCTGTVPLALFHRNHGTITQPPGSGNLQEPEWAARLLAALTIDPVNDPAAYATHIKACEDLTRQTRADGQAGPHKEWYHEYQHVVFRVHDQHGMPVTDYVVEFYGQNGSYDDPTMEYIHKEIIEVVTTNSVDPSYRCFFIDATDLKAYIAKGNVVFLRLSAAAISQRIFYRNPQQGVEIFSARNSTFIRPDEPILVDVTLYRDPNIDDADPGRNVFRIHH